MIRDRMSVSINH